MALILAVRDLAAERGGRPVLADVSFSLAGGEALSVVGPNGAGKSTLLRILAGLLPSQAGRATLDPPEPDDPDAPLGERTHYLGHADALKSSLTPREHLDFAGRLLGRPGDGSMPPAEALDRVALRHATDLPCGYLSAGQRRRVAIARLLVAARPLWLLDEPATALDAASQAILAALMREHLGRGNLIVAATHGPIGLDRSRELRLA